MAFSADPPAATALQHLIAPESWQHCGQSLAALLDSFALRCTSDDNPGAMPATPHLPYTLLRFDWLLCDTVRGARGSFAHRLALLRWLLLPYLARKHMQAPFHSLAEDADSVVCWACTLQAVLLLQQLCREASLRGAPQRYAALAMLRHIDSEEYASRTTRLSLPAPDEAAVGMDGDDMEAASPLSGAPTPAFAQEAAGLPGMSTGAATPWSTAGDGDAGRRESFREVATRSLLQRVYERCDMVVDSVDTEETLAAAQDAVHELLAWQRALEAEDGIACMQRAVATGAPGFMHEENVAHVLAAAASACAGDQEGADGGPSSSAAALSGTCAVPQGAGPMQLQLCLAPLAPEQDGNELWGGSDAITAAHHYVGRASSAASIEALCQDLQAPLQARLAQWSDCGSTGCTVSVQPGDDDADFAHVTPSLEGTAASPPAQICVTIAVDAPAIAGAVQQRLGSDEQALAQARRAVAECMDAAVTVASDALRCEPLAVCW